MSWTPPKPTDADRQTLFPFVTPPPPADVFELGLVLGGTVSAGAFTAGVLDYLTEALDAWDLAREAADPLAPVSRVVLKVTGGASGGGVCSSILARLAPYAFPHVPLPTTSLSTGNLFYDAWVNTLDIKAMLNTSDLANNQVLASVLNVAPIDTAGQLLTQYVGHPLGEAGTNTPAARRWLDPTLNVFFTLTNLRGVPYQIDFNGGTQNSRTFQQSFVDHADFVRFQVDTRAGVTDPIRADAFGVSAWRDGDAFADWSTIRDFTMATAAFPIGFKARDLSRPASHYAYRGLLSADNAGAPVFDWLTPDWDALADASGNLSPAYAFPSVDGGAADNSPVELVRTALAGINGRNPRDGSLANRALILIDPFADGVTLGPATIADVETTLIPLASGLLGQARYSTADLLLAVDQNVFSRFMITARRGEYVGLQALATGGLAAFQGFLSRSFREHDYFLGRRNAYEFLKDQFALPANNPLFNNWTPDQKTKYAIQEADQTYLPIIPLVPLLGPPNVPPQYPIWPTNTFQPETLQDAIANRVSAVVSTIENKDISSNIFIHAYLWPMLSQLRGELTDKIMAAIQASLKASNL